MKRCWADEQTIIELVRQRKEVAVQAGSVSTEHLGGNALSQVKNNDQ